MTRTISQPVKADRCAKELAKLAVDKQDPGTRAFLLGWAKLFRELAALGSRDHTEVSDRRH